MNQPLGQRWRFLAIATALAIVFHVGMEWLFFVTKPSFMSALGAGRKAAVLAFAPLPPVLLGLALVGGLGLAAFLLDRRGVRRAGPTVLLAAARTVPATVLAAAILLLIDNFTYTVLGFGIRTATSPWHFGYGLLLVAVGGALFVWLRRWEGRTPQRFVSRRALLAVLAGPAIAAAAAGLGLGTGPTGSGDGGVGAGARTAGGRLPNILLIAADGLDADRTSIYGYARETTPFIGRYLEPGALICENAFANAGNSGASIVAMLTGKTPLQTKVYYPPDILRGADAYQHLPAILRAHGYRNFDVSIRHYADPYDMNMRDSFDESNFRRVAPRRASRSVSAWIGGDAAYFLGRVADRLANRALRITGRQWLPDAFDQVMGAHRETALRGGAPVDAAVAAFLSFVDESPAPFFAHLHLLPTHGPRFHPRLRHFSAGQEETADWLPDFYDDAVLTFDAVFDHVMRSLRQRGHAHDTLVILHSDHGQTWSVGVRVPLVFVFPGRQHAGRVVNNVQNLDIPATVLDYLGIPRPAWMGGVSLISETPPADRPVITTASRLPEQDDVGLWVAAKSSYGPPFHNLGKVGMVICDRFYLADLGDPARPVLSSRPVAGHTAPCGDADRAAAFARLFAALQENGFDLTATDWRGSLDALAPEQP